MERQTRHPRISVLTPTIREEGLLPLAKSLRQQTFQDMEWLIEINISNKADFNAAMNRMLRRARGELIVSAQDWLTLPQRGLESFWEAHQREPAFYTAPVGKRQGEQIKWDWRMHRHEAEWNEWEIDWGAAPLSALKEIGGFDEELDRYWGFDNVNVGLRAHLAGYKFKCLSQNAATAEDHDVFMAHPFRQNRNPQFHNERLDQIRRGLTLTL